MLTYKVREQTLGLNACKISSIQHETQLTFSTTVLEHVLWHISDVDITFMASEAIPV